MHVCNVMLLLITYKYTVHYLLLTMLHVIRMLINLM